MIMHESIKIFCFLFLSILDQYVFLHSNFWWINWMFFPIFITKNTNANVILFFLILWMPLTFTGNLMSLKSSFLPKSLSAFTWFTGFKYLTILYLKHSLSSIFWILNNPFLGWFNSFSNLMLLAKDYIFKY